MGFLKSLGKFALKATATIATTTTGIVAATVEEMGAATGCEPLANLAHGAKSASFNATRKMWGKETKEYERSDGSSFRNQMERAAERSEKLRAEYERKAKQSASQTKNRRTDAELERDRTGLNRRARDFQYRERVRLPEALEIAESTPGVYILFLNGKVMKCGRAAYGQGIHWRFQQYYSLNYDDRARNKDYWSVSPSNRDSIMVSWQCCPVSKCKELEFKLFRKYGKGPWGLRAPQSCSENSWELLI